jgi:xanthine dehydrogenase molybdopterin-binding subunit B
MISKITPHESARLHVSGETVCVDDMQAIVFPSLPRRGMKGEVEDQR